MLNQINITKIITILKQNFFLSFAFVGILVPRFVNLNPYLGYFTANNLLDILIAPAHFVVATLVIREFWINNFYYKLFSIGLISLGVIQIYAYNPSFFELFHNITVTLQILLWLSVLPKIFTNPILHKTQKLSLLIVLLLYSLLDHLLFSNPISVLVVWIISQMLTSNNKYWIHLFGLFLAINLLTTIWQVVSGYSLGLHILGEGYLSPQISGIARQPIGDFRLLLLRGYGLMQHPNVLGFVGSLSVWYFSSGYFNKQTISNNFLTFFNIKINTRSLLSASATLIAILSFSRIAWLSLAFLLILILFEKKYPQSKINISNLWNFLKTNFQLYWWVWLGAVAVSLYVYLSRFAYNSGTDFVRMQEYSDFVKTYNQLSWTQKLFGVGLGNYIFYIRTFNLQWHWWEWQPIHNIWLSTFFELGIVVVCVIIISLIIIGVNNSKMPKKAKFVKLQKKILTKIGK